MKNIIIKSLLLSKSQKQSKQKLAYKSTNDNFLNASFGQFKIRSKNGSPKQNSEGNNDRSD